MGFAARLSDYSNSVFFLKAHSLTLDVRGETIKVHECVCTTDEQYTNDSESTCQSGRMTADKCRLRRQNVTVFEQEEKIPHFIM